MTDVEEYLIYAKVDKEPTSVGDGHGFYQCYCKFHSEFSFNMAKDDFCYEYQYSQFTFTALKNGISVIITVLNVFLRIVTIKSINLIGFNQKTQVTMEIMTTCFYTMFVNTAMIQLLSSANFEQTVLRWIPIRNNYNDFVSEWYVVLGTSLQTTMIVTAFMPYVTFGIGYITKQLSIFKDRGF